jgi:uncharacterized protein DUF6644
MLPLFEWCEHNALTAAMARSTWLLPLFEVLHLFGLTVLIGSVVIVSLRLMGAIMPRRPVSELAREFRAWTIFALIAQVTSGLALFSTESVRWYNSGPFWVKMSLLLTAVVFQFTVFRAVTNRDDAGPLVRCVTAAVALTLWFGVGLAGRAITNL